MAQLTGKNFRLMRDYFDKTLDPFNVRTTSRDRTRMGAEEALTWNEDVSTRYGHKLIGPLQGKRVLEIGCGLGVHLIWFARRGAYVTGIDVSEKRVAKAREIVRKAGFEERVSLHVLDAEDTGLPDASYDLVYGQDVLMYFDGRFSRVIEEMKRILKNGGYLVYSEALGRHPVARYYRRHVAPGEWKVFTHYFDVDYIRQFRAAFGSVEYRTFYLAGFPVYAVKMYVPIHALFVALDMIFNVIDRVIMTLCPGLGRFCWRVVFKAVKQKKGINTK